MIFKALIFLIFTLSLSQCESEKFCTSPACERETENIRNISDPTIDACDDFYSHVCGRFIKITPIPETKISVGAFNILNDELKLQINSVLKSPITSDEIQPFKNAKILFKACMNEDKIQKQGLSPMKQYLKLVGGWPVIERENWNGNIWSWQNVSLELEKQGFQSNQIFELYVDSDMKNSSKRTIIIDEMSPEIDREYLIEGFEDSTVQAYYKYQVDTAVLFGAERFNAELEMKEVVQFEINFANILTPQEQRRNMTLRYNPMTIKEFQKLFPIIDWLVYFNEIYYNNNITDDEVMIVTDLKDIVGNVTELLKSTPNRVIVNYLLWRTVASQAKLLNSELRNLQLEFYKTLIGQQAVDDRWKECINTVLEKMPIATSAMYVRNFFSKESKDEALNLANAIKDEFENTLKMAEWMDNETKLKALEKIKEMTMHIGYPNELKDDDKLNEFYKNLQLHDEDNYFESLMKIARFDVKIANEYFRKPMNKTDWKDFSNVAVVNAYYMLTKNGKHLPAGILQKAFFAVDRPKYMNYGAIGTIIGHEITHGYDDEGSQFDANGNLVDWWQEDTKRAYVEKAQCIIDQYNQYVEPITGLNLNGINTQGENIADNGGISIAYHAYTRYIKQNGEELPLPGLNYTSKQLFWISAATPWCIVKRPEALKLMVTSDPHSTAQYRVNGMVSNMHEFSRDFNCPIDSKMNPKRKCKVW